MGWAVSNPEKRRALAQLGVSDEITPASRAAGHKTMAGIAKLMERSCANGPMCDADGVCRCDHELLILSASVVATSSRASGLFLGERPVRAKHSASAYWIGREPLMRISTNRLALSCQSGLVETLATPMRARRRSIGSRSLRMSPLLIARFTSARIASQIWP